MNLFESLIVLFLVWWLSLFLVLPWGNRPTEDPELGHERGAPARPRLWMKVLITTAIALVIWTVIYLVIDSGLISFRAMVEPR